MWLRNILVFPVLSSYNSSMSKLKKAKENEYIVTHDTFFDETFGMPSLGVAFLKKVLPRDPNAPELHVVLMIMKVVFSKNRTTLKSSFSAILKDLKPYSKNQKYYELIRKFWYYVVYNTEKLTEADYEELETEIQETIGDDKMPTLVQKWLAQGWKKEWNWVLPKASKKVSKKAKSSLSS